MKRERDAIASCLATAQRVAITSHSSPDGDGLGSGLGLARALERRGIHAEFICSDALPRRYHFLPGADMVRQQETRLAGAWDVVVLVECPDVARCGLQALEGYRLINIDHHALNARYGELNWIDPSAAAVGEMIFDLLPGLQVDLDPEIATNLYTALVSDTGSFRYSNTTPRTFEIAGALVAAGCRPAEVSQALYEQQPTAYVGLLQQVLNSLQLDPDGRVAWITLEAEVLERIRSDGLDTEDLINYPRALAGVEVALFFKELSEACTKVSFRSRGRVDVAALAGRFGGGGHKKAAGCALEGSLTDVRERILEAVRAELGSS